VLRKAGVSELQADLPTVLVFYVLLGLLLSRKPRRPLVRKNGGVKPQQQSIQSELFSRGGSNVALKITNREVDGVAVVALEGRIVLGEESNALRERVKSLLASNQKKIVLNMDNVTYIDSAGLGTLVAAHHSAKSQSAALKLCNLGSKFQEVLQVTKLLTVFDVFKNEAEAVQSFAK
jgi:anti-sigma B factor antagonist